MKYGKIKEITIYSKALDEEMQLLIHLPHNFSPLINFRYLSHPMGKIIFNTVELVVSLTK